MLDPEELQTLSSAPIFRNFTVDQLEDLLASTAPVRQSFVRGEQICSPEQFRKELAVVLTGRITVTKGGGDLVVSTLSPGEVFGAASLFNEEPEYVSTLTARSAASALFFSQEKVRRLIDTQPFFRDGYIRYLSQRIRFLSDKIDALIQTSGEKKLCSWLLSQSDSDGKIQLRFSMTELAARLNISRAALYREMQKLEEHGVILRKGHQIHILRPDALSS